MVQNNHDHQPEIPCGSPSCLASTMETALSKQSETQNKFIKELFETHVANLTERINQLNKNLDKNLDEIYERLRNAENDINLVKSKQVGTTKCTEEMAAESKKIAALEAGAFTKDEKDRIMTVVKFYEDQKSFRTRVLAGVIVLIILAGLGWGLYIYHMHPLPGTSQAQQATNGKE